MSKHVHLYIHRARQRAADAGNFDEGKHKRDADGKFATSGGNAEHHLAQYKHHLTQVAANPHAPDALHHMNAANAHFSAGHRLNTAQMVSDPKHRDHGALQEHLAVAERHAQEAAQHGAKLSKAPPAQPPKKDAATVQRESDLRMAAQHLAAAQEERAVGNLVGARHHMQLHKKFKAVAEGAPRDAATGGPRDVNLQPRPQGKKS